MYSSSSTISSGECLFETSEKPGAGRSWSNIVNFYQNRSILITGGSGFIGKVLIEKLLRQCAGVKHIYVLIRPKWNKQPHERLNELLKATLFDQVRDLQHKVIVVEGDVTQVNLGLSEQNLLRIMNEVSVIYHSAATVKFDEPLKQSIAINIAGTKNMIDLCRKIPQLAALVHVSTAYANCDIKEIDEHIYPIDMDPERLIELASWLDQETLQELKIRLLKARPNTYTYTKALAEWLLVKCARDLPVVVCRPSIVVASWREPFSGWIDNVNGPTGIILGAGKGLIRSMYADPDCVADLVPVDTVINLVITLGWFAHVYSSQKQLNDAAESLTESMIGSGSSSSCEDSLDGFTSGHVINSLADDNNILNKQLNVSSSHSDNNNSDTNNNNNNDNSSPNFGVPIISVKGPSKLEQAHLTYQSDEGYASARQTPDAKLNTLSLSSSSSLIRTSSNNNNNNNIIHHPDASTKHSITTTCPVARITMTGTVCNNNQLPELHPHPALANDNISKRVSVTNRQQDHKSLNISFAEQRRLAQQKQAAFDYKLKQFRHNMQLKLSASSLNEDIADVPVFHCTSGDQNPITWARIQVLILTMLAIYPSLTTYRYPCGSFTKNKRLDNFYRYTLHYIPGYILDFVTRLFGGKPVLVKVYKKFDQAANVLQAFTLRQWTFKSDNRMLLINELMSEEDKRLFNFDLRGLDWTDFLHDYVLGVRKYLLKESISNLKEARANLRFVYVRNLSLQVLFFAISLYYINSFTFNMNLNYFKLF